MSDCRCCVCWYDGKAIQSSVSYTTTTAIGIRLFEFNKLLGFEACGYMKRTIQRSALHTSNQRNTCVTIVNH
ncbi:hypothetical protein OUZ56_000850 [Daphnia magna]|uniref:Uncharacterized protein n=1 Tax=Daphnia magna TaxID=35525 RepID=A0ABR0A0Z1_9CRUS|nr:hypothetical protein OUZ56_000850 [Daphnia magna]